MPLPLPHNQDPHGIHSWTELLTIVRGVCLYVTTLFCVCVCVCVCFLSVVHTQVGQSHNIMINQSGTVDLIMDIILLALGLETACAAPYMQ